MEPSEAKRPTWFVVGRSSGRPTPTSQIPVGRSRAGRLAAGRAGPDGKLHHGRCLRGLRTRGYDHAHSGYCGRIRLGLARTPGRVGRLDLLTTREPAN